MNKSKEEELDEMYLKVEPLVEKMKAKYPPELNMEGLEPALSSDIAEIVLAILASHQREVEESVEELRKDYSLKDYSHSELSAGLVYEGYNQAIDDTLSILRGEERNGRKN